MALRLPHAEIWVQTVPCELRSDCGLERYHIHVEDQIFYSFEELDVSYGKDAWEIADPPKVGAGPLERVKEWISVGTVVGGGQLFTAPVGTPLPGSGRASDHLHIGITDSPEVRPGDLVTITGTGGVVRAGAGDKIAGVVVQTKFNASGGGAVDINTDIESWKAQHRVDPAELLQNTRTVQ